MQYQQEPARRYIQVPVAPGMSDADIRKATRLMPNGAYAVQICRKCGIYAVKPDGYLKDAKIVDECEHCFGR